MEVIQPLVPQRLPCSLAHSTIAVRPKLGCWAPRFASRRGLSHLPSKRNRKSCVWSWGWRAVSEGSATTSLRIVRTLALLPVYVWSGLLQGSQNDTRIFPHTARFFLEPSGSGSQLFCYDLAPLAKLRLASTECGGSSEPDLGDLTGGVYKEQGLIRR